MYSLKKTTTRHLVINMLVVMSGLLIIMYFSMQQILQDYVLTRLQHDADSLISVIQQDQKQQWQINPSQMSTVYNRVKSGHYYRASVNNEVITSRSLFDNPFPLPDRQLALSDYYLTDGPGMERWLVWFQQVNKKGHSINIWVAEDIKPLQQQLLKYTGFAVILVLLVTALLILLQYHTLKKSFQVFEFLRQNLSSIRHKQIEKFGVDIPDEILPLVNEIELLVAQLRNRIKRTRHAIGNLAHELKRPIQLLTIQLEDRDEDEELLTPLKTIKQTIDRELRRAKISGSQSAGGDFNPAEELPVLIKIMSKIYPKIQVNLEPNQTVKSIQLDRDDMLELMGNLLDNACKFAQHSVQIELKIKPQQFSFIIADDGQGLNVEQIEKIKNRGVRLDETIEGHGLGLSICRDIVDSYNGEIQFSQSTLGGLKVTVQLAANALAG